MGELKHRAYFSTTLPKEIIKEIDNMSKETRIPKSRLAEEAWEDLFKKYKRTIKKPGR